MFLSGPATSCFEPNQTFLETPVNVCQTLSKLTELERRILALTNRDNKMYRVLGGGFGGGRTPGRRAKDGVQGDDGIFHGGDGGRSQGGDRRGLEQEEPGETQTAAMMEPHGGADGGRSHGGGKANDSMGPTDGGGAGGGRTRGGDGEPKILDDPEDPEGPGGAQGSGDRGGGGDAEIRRSAPERRRTEAVPAGGRRSTEPEGRSDEAQPEEWSPEVKVGRRLTRAEPEGRWSPVELVDRRATVETRELRDGVEPQGRRAEVESRTQRLEAKMRDPPAMTPMETGRPAANPPHRRWAEGELGG
ncbi:Collagen alpha-5(VI) chain [Labeo rohita]|uniref:Collagen alpha-5(VI) chain n=1 Tax=Labeo rohita TaxID=84645 RepID=A0ABQ8LXV5_LABRO|nr:Collagen alpha-5(VI) chain [Labeo rohita]